MMYNMYNNIKFKSLEVFYEYKNFKRRKRNKIFK